MSDLPLDPRLIELGAKAFYSTDQVQKLGPYLLGMWIDAVLLGCLFALFVEWLRFAYRSEKVGNKVLMIYLLVVSCIVSIYVVAHQTYLFVDNFGTYRQFLNPAWYRVSWLLNTFSRIPAAVFFTHRAYLINNRSLVVPLLAIPLLLTSMGCSFGAFLTSKTVPIRHGSLERIFVIVFISTELAADLVNSVAIAVGLIRCRRQAEKQSMARAIIKRLLFILAETQLPPTLATLSFLIVFLGGASRTTVFGFAGIAKIHVLCLVIVLISRVHAIAPEPAPALVNTPSSSLDTDTSYIPYKLPSQAQTSPLPRLGTSLSNIRPRQAGSIFMPQPRIESDREFEKVPGLIVEEDA